MPGEPIRSLTLTESSNLSDTNSESTRLYRAERLVSFYGLHEEGGVETPETIDDLNGKSAEDRYRTIRNNLFPRDEFEELNPGEETFTRKTVPLDRFYPKLEAARDVLWPSYLNIVDTAYGALLGIESTGDREAAFKRLGSFVHTMGIMIHPSVDGNGQSFKTLTLSYLREGCSQYADAYLPLKLGQNLHQKKLDIYGGFAGDFLATPLPKLKPEDILDQQLFDLLDKINELHMEYVNYPKDDKKGKRLAELMTRRNIYLVLREHSEKLGIDLSEIEDPDSLEEFHGPDGERLKAPFSALMRSKWAIKDVLINKGHDKDLVDYSILDAASKSAKSTMFLTHVLARPECAEALVNYIVTGDTALSDIKLEPEVAVLFFTAIKNFQLVESDISKLLNDPEISSVSAIKTQLAIGVEYAHINDQLEAIWDSNSLRAQAILGRIDTSDPNLTQVQILDLLKLCIQETEGMSKEDLLYY